MAASYENALQMAESLSRNDQLRLIWELTARAEASASEPASVLEFDGLGAEVWQSIDAQEYIHRERSSWNG